MMKLDEERGMSMSPPMTNTSSHNMNSGNGGHGNVSPSMMGGNGNLSGLGDSSLYSNMLPAAAMGMLAPQFFNQQAAAAAFMGLPMQLRATLAASGLFPHPNTLFSAWAHQTLAANAHSPTMSAEPLSPALSNKSGKNNNIVSTTTTDLHHTSPMSKLGNLNHHQIASQQKKSLKRKQSSGTGSMLKKEFMSPVHSMDGLSDMLHSGPISPPTSGSSPQSTGSLEHAVTATTTTTHSHPTPAGNKDKVFTCKICNRSFGYKHVLQNHERTHTGEKPFECPECHKRFTRDHHLKTHMRLHTGEKPYHCSHCDRQFVQVANLRRHLRVHTGERPYSCELCDARFSDSNQLKAHMLIHNGEKPFGCDRCSARFRRRHHLLHHKCGMASSSPPTPVMSPAMSDMKSASSRSDASDESLDLSKTNLHHPLQWNSPPLLLGAAQLLGHGATTPPYSVPLDMSDETPELLEKRSSNSHQRKSENRRVMRMPQQVLNVSPTMPEQTEPEDLSMHSPRSIVSPPMSHDDYEDLDELDDAASLYMKQRHHQQKTTTTPISSSNKCQSIEP